jgi:hypothetical protein
MSDTLPLVHLPIAWQESRRSDPRDDPPDGPDSPLGRLLRDMNAFLDSLRASAPLSPDAAVRGPPDVHFGCPADMLGGCIETEDETPSMGRFELSVEAATGGWRRWVGEALDGVGAGGLLVLTLEFAYYWPEQTNLRGDKVIELGTDYTVPVPWLTALNAPVTVLQVTGALVDREGRATRLGAEGLFAKRPGLLRNLIGVQAVIRDEEVELVRTLRREDLPGAPLVWQAALHALVTGLTGAPRTMR